MVKYFNEKEHDLLNKVILVLGSQGSGKTVLINELIEKIKNDLPKDYNSCIVRDYDKTVIKGFIDQQIKNIRNPEIKDPRSLLVVDGVNNDWIGQNEFRFLFVNGRSAKITFVMSCQDPVTLPPQLRANVDYIFICDQTYKDSIFNNYGLFENKQQFDNAIDQYTKDYNVAVIKNTIHFNNLDDIVFTYKASPELI